jgi:hypothetical protein
MTSGSKYVAVVFAVLCAYFVYVWWFNPVRAIKRRLGELAATLSVPDHDGDLARVARVANLRRYFAEDVRVSAGAGAPLVTSREALLAAVAAFRAPAGGRDVQFVDLKVTLDAGETAHAVMTVEVTGRDARSGERTADARPATATLAKRNGDWVITSAASPEIPTRP